MEEIILIIKKKRELSDLPDSLVKEALNKYLKKHNIKLPNNPKQQKPIIKAIRAELRKYAGQYAISSKKRNELFASNKISALLKTHTSTKERLSSKTYPKLKSLINKVKPKSVLDLGCGLNPLAISDPKIFYYAVDIKESELNLIKEYFKEHKIKGKTILADIRSLKKLPKTDLTLVLKTFDIIDNKTHKITRSLLQKIPSKHIIASFSTRTLSGKPMRSPKRQWFESILKSQNLTYTTKLTSNEVFYIIEKSRTLE